MADRLNPPYIEGKIPARYGDIIKVPFRMNSTVNKELITGFNLKVKTLIQKNNNDTLFTTNTLVNEKEVSLKQMIENGEAQFNLTIPEKKEKLKVGQYYKIQLAFLSEGNIEGYYSTVGILKWTTKGEVSIQGLKKGQVNYSNRRYVGVYKQENRDYPEYTSNADPTEKVVEYRFRLLKTYSSGKEETVEDTGWLIHDSSQDTSMYESTDSVEFYTEIPQGDNSYRIQYHVKTNNGLSLPVRYEIIAPLEIPIEKPMEWNVKNNEENGYVQLGFKGDNITYGTFTILRRDINKQYEWEEITDFVLAGEKPEAWYWKDFTVEHNKTYIYAYQQFFDNSEGVRLYSVKFETDPITVKFEHAFLWDGKQQLKIKYNPKISSFRTTILEAKTETIGSKYPFIFRNGRIAYKDFPISGLISYLSDDENLFADNDLFLFNEDLKRYDQADSEINWNKIRTTNLTDENFRKERNFKIRVLNWLNDGKIKLFRSPGEGNYLVRIMNVSLTPNDTLGRMIHDFSCNAYEMDSVNYENLLKYGFLENEEEKFKEKRQVSFWESVKARDFYNAETEDWVEIKPKTKNINITSLKFENMTPGDLIKLEKKDYSTILMIGATGSLFLENLEPITKMSLKENNPEQNNDGVITYSYTKVFNNYFGFFEKIEEIINVPVRQINGNTIRVNPETKARSLIDNIKDIKTFINKISYIKFYKAPIKKMGYEKFDEIEQRMLFYKDKACQNLMELKDGIIYETINGKYYYWLFEEGNTKRQGYYAKDGEYAKFLFSFSVNNNIIDLEDTLYYEMKMENMHLMNIDVQPGINIEIGYTAFIMQYSFENWYDLIHTEFKNAKADYLNYLKNKITNEEQDFNFYLNNYNQAYNLLILNLKIQLDKYKDKGEVV